MRLKQALIFLLPSFPPPFNGMREVLSGFFREQVVQGFEPRYGVFLRAGGEVYDDLVAVGFIEKRPSYGRAYGYLAVFRVNLFRGYELKGEVFAGIRVFEIHL